MDSSRFRQGKRWVIRGTALAKTPGLAVFVQPCLFLSSAVLCVSASLREAQAFSLARSLHSLKPQRSRRGTAQHHSCSWFVPHFASRPCLPLCSLRPCGLARDSSRESFSGLPYLDC
jgi:hypothetical protein